MGIKPLASVAKFPCMLDRILFVTDANSSELVLFSLTWDGPSPGVE